MPGLEESFLPGGGEAVRARTERAEGSPVGPTHQQRLEEIDGELGLQVPW